ncbi:alpha/beta hydrolase [Candidatus Bipolaricaulota bacterium]|nr:alpha/beta hydrolase [Candidatus Bipolaricaulota bacterium]
MNAFRIDEFDAYLRYHDLPGSEPALVFLHGLGAASSADFPAIASHARLRDHRSLLIDLLGHGFSDHPSAFDYSMEAQAGFVARLLRSLGVKHTIVIGHSMGGSVAILLAASEADLVSHVISAEGNLDPGPGFVSGRITAMPEQVFAALGHGEFVSAILRAGFAEYAGTFQAGDPIGLYRSALSLIAGRSPTYREHLTALPIARTYVFGEETLPDPDVDRLQEAGIDVRVVPRAGHGMMIDNPDGFAAALADAIEQAR